MSMFKKTFSTTYLEELSEAYTFLGQNAGAYFDEIKINPEVPSEIQCITNLENNEKTIFTVKITGLTELPTARCNMIFESSKSGFSYSHSTGGQTPLVCGYSCSNGVALAMNYTIRGNFVWTFITKDTNGETIIFMPYLLNSQLYAWAVMPAHPEIQLDPVMLSFNGNQVVNWTFLSDGISLTGMPLRDQSASEEGQVDTLYYSPCLYRVSYSPFSYGSANAHGKLTVNEVDFITNGYIALED